MKKKIKEKKVYTYIKEVKVTAETAENIKGEIDRLIYTNPKCSFEHI